MPKIVFNTRVERYDCSGCRFFDRYKKGGYCEYFKTCIVWFNYGHLDYYAPCDECEKANADGNAEFPIEITVPENFCSSCRQFNKIDKKCRVFKQSLSYNKVKRQFERCDECKAAEVKNNDNNSRY